GAPLIGGTSTAVDGLAAGLSQNGAKVTVLCEGRERSSVRTSRGYAIECFAGSRRHRSFSVAPGLKRYVADRLAGRSSISLVNGMFHPGAYGMGKVLHACGIPYIAVPHDPYDQAVFRRNPHLKWPYWYFFERRLLRRARAVQLLDLKHAAGLRRLGVGIPVIETPNGVASDTVPHESQLRWHAAAGRIELMFLGRIDAYNKGLDILVDAFARVAEYADVGLTMRGPDWGDRSRLERRAAAWAVADRVTIHEPDYQRSSPEIIADYDIFCLPSRFEGFGLAALEAMLAGRVLLVSETAGVARHVQASGCGVVVRPTVTDIAAGLDALIQRRAQWRDMGLSGRRHALENLQWKSIAAAALEQYQQVLN
ncbi:MAG: glycosyltransferase, partial [Burkholderiales bacterium]|nr:glycosyltransferase [Burkholderiales bacterium]